MATPNDRPWLTAPKKPPLIWIDCEMTGLDLNKDQIIEICCLVTDGALELLDPVGFECVIKAPKPLLEGMDEWCQTHHKASGLYDQSLESSNTMEETEKRLLEYIKKFAITSRSGVLAGNSVHVDRQFLCKDMPSVAEYLHYRIVDVSTIKTIGERHNPQRVRKVPRKKQLHTARADILESIEELRWYYNNYLRTD